MTYLRDGELASMRRLYKPTMTQTVQIYYPSGPPSSSGRYPYNDPPVVVPAHILHKEIQVFTAAGRQAVAATTVKVPVGTVLATNIKLVLPNGEAPPVLAVDDAAPSDDWPLYAQIFTGKA